MNSFKKLSVIFVLLLFPISIFAQSVNLSESFVAGESDAVIYYPVGWTLKENSPTYYQLVEIEFDLSSGQQPRGVMMSIFVHPKSEIHLSDYSLMSVFDALASPPRGETFEPYEVENMAFSMMRGDAMMPGNVNFSAIVVDVSDEFWLYISIMNSDKSIVDEILGGIVSGSENEASGESADEMPANATYTVVLMETSSPAIDVIKVIRSITGLGLAEAKALSDTVPDSVVLENVTFETAESAVAELEAAGGIVNLIVNEREPVVEETPIEVVETESSEVEQAADTSELYDVVITEIGDSKINVIKAVRSVTGLGLKDAKDLVESDDAIVLSGIDLTTAENAQTELETAGATITLVGETEAEMACDMESDEGNMSLILMDSGDDEIEIIKAVRAITDLGLGDSRDLVHAAPDSIILEGGTQETLEAAQTQLQDLGATVEIRTIASDCDGMTTDGIGSGLYDVVITEIGDSKINVIKAVRSITGLGLKDAKDLVESEDGIILAGVDLAAAENAQTELEAVGATVSLIESP